MHSKLSSEDFEVERLLGEGSFSKIYRATNKESGEQVALKVVDFERARSLRKGKEILMEKHCLLKLNPCSYRDKTVTVFQKSPPSYEHFMPAENAVTEHGSQHIIRLFHTYKTKSHLCLVMELCDEEELWDMVKGAGLQSTERLNWCLTQICSGLDYIHSRQIIHRDLKAENIVKSISNQLKILDFGTAVDCELPFDDTLAGNSHTSVRARQALRCFVGTPQFMPPEARHGWKNTVSYASDVWSFGCLVYQVATGAAPFQAPSEYLVFVRAHYLDLDIPAYLDSKIAQLIHDCLRPDINERPSIQDLSRNYYPIMRDTAHCPCFSVRAEPAEGNHFWTFRSMWSHLRSLLIEEVQKMEISQSAVPECTEWLFHLYGARSIRLKGDATARSASVFDRCALTPGSQPWCTVFAAAKRYYSNLTADVLSLPKSSILSRRWNTERETEDLHILSSLADVSVVTSLPSDLCGMRYVGVTYTTERETNIGSASQIAG